MIVVSDYIDIDAKGSDGVYIQQHFLKRVRMGNSLTRQAAMLYNHPRQLNSLIKSGGGNGPMKPGNLQKRS